MKIKIKFLSIFFLLLLAAASANAQGKEQSRAVAIGAGNYWVEPFDMYSDGGIFSGRFRAQGGSNNDVEVFVVDGDGYENFRNGNAFKCYYQSGKKTVESFSVKMPKIRFYLIISNKFSMFSSKAVELTLY